MNLNNILGSDSISPCGYYPRRLRGNKRFYPVPPNNLEDVLFLYDKIPSYVVDQSMGVNFRLVLAIDFDEMFEKPEFVTTESGINIYSVQGTVHLNPLMCRLLFDNESEYNHILTLVEQSAENKTFHLYKSGKISPDICQNCEIRGDYQDMPDGDMLNKIRKDAIYDKNRGAIIAYIAGRNQAPSAEVIELRKYARNIKNLLASVINSPSHTFTPSQEEEMGTLVKDFDYLFSKVDPISKENQNIIERGLSRSDTLQRLNVSKEDALSILKELGVDETFKQIQGVKRTFDIYSVYSCLNSEDIAKSYNDSMSQLSKAISNVEAADISDRYCTLEECVSVTSEGRFVFQTEDNGSNFFNEYVEALTRGEQLIIAEQENTKKDLSLALLGGKILKSIVGEKWEESSHRRYINDLLGNLQKGTPFEIASLKNPILQSFAAFVLKGTDIDKLTDFLVLSSIPDYKYAWAMHGAAYGYATMSKSFTNSVLRVKEYSKDLITAIDNALYRDFTISKIADVSIAEPAPINIIPSTPEQKETAFAQNVDTKPVVTDSDSANKEMKKEEPKSSLIKEVPGYYDLKVLLLSLKQDGILKKKLLSDKDITAVLDIYNQNPEFNSKFLALLSGKFKESSVKYKKIKALLFPDSYNYDIFGQHYPESERNVEESKPIEHTASKIPDKQVNSKKKNQSTKSSQYSSGSQKYSSGSPKCPPHVVSIVDSLNIGNEDTKELILDKLSYVINKHLGEKPSEWINHFGHLAFFGDKKAIEKTPNNELIVKQLIERLRESYPDGR